MRKLLVLAALAVAFAGPAQAEGDAELGEKVFRKCKACHMVGEGARTKAGPELNNIIGATAGTKPDFARKYSDAMVEAGKGGLVWNTETLDPYLEKPRKFLKGTRMTFAGLRNAEERANVIAYLAQFSEPADTGPEHSGAAD